jgi:sRNA-binding protein
MTLAQCAQELAARFPALFGAQGGPLPIKLRIHVDIAARAPGVFTRRVLAAFLSRHTTSTAYLKALIKATHRTDLDGANAGEVLPEHREAATAELARRQALVQARRAQGSTGPRDSAMARRPGGPPKAESHAHAKVAREGIPGTLKSTLKGAPRAGAGPSPHRRREGRAEAISPRSSMNEDQRARADLLRAYETTTLTKANFCALKGWTEDALDQALALAREENRARRPDVTRQYSPPATRSSR